MKAVYGWLIVLVALVVVIGCGGGGGDGGTGVTDGTDSGTTGIIARDTAGTPLAGLTYRFYNNAGVQVGQATTNASGKIGGIPAGATRFTIDMSGLAGAANYFNQFSYNDKEYLANDTNCLAIIGGGSFRTDTVLTLRWMGPPPPPDGCLNG